MNQLTRTMLGKLRGVFPRYDKSSFIDFEILADNYI